MRIFVTGWNGLLGASFVPLLRPGHEVEGYGILDADLADQGYLRGRLARFRPDAVVHLAAFTAVDACESEEEKAFQVNAEGSRIVAEEAARAGASILSLSTDYVFDGAGRTPYREDDPPAPGTVYGKSKLAGEEAIRKHPAWAVVRSAWLYGPGGRNFVDTILAALDAGGEVSVADDQVGSPTYALDLARGLLRLLEGKARGLYHLVNGGEASWFDLARESARLTGRKTEQVRPARTSEAPRPAPRPAYSVLDCGRAARDHGVRLRPWPDALADYLSKERSPR